MDWEDYERQEQEDAERMHRTLVHLLIDGNQRELAAVIVDGNISFHRDNNCICGIIIELPTHGHSMLMSDESLKKRLIAAGKLVCENQFTDQNRELVSDPTVIFRLKRMDMSDDWRNVARSLIAESSGNNQAAVAKKVFARYGREMLTYNEMSYASQSEIRVAQEFEERKVLFFPLAVAVRRDTNQHYKDHRETDFLVCDNGTWGILEVSYHPDRFEKDAEKDAWFKRSGVLCVQHYTAERCFNESAGVVDEFLSILSQHRRT